MAIHVYISPHSAPSRAVLMAAKQLSIEVETTVVDFMAGEHFSPEFTKINPAQCVPTIDDDGFYLWESRAILTYLANQYAPDNSLYPKDPKKRAIVDRMLYFDMNTLYKTEGEYVYPQLLKGLPPHVEQEEEFTKALTLLELFLSQTPYVAGDQLTLADISVFANLTFIETIMDYDFSGFSKISAWMQKLKCELPYHNEINVEPLEAAKKRFKGDTITANVDK